MFQFLGKAVTRTWPILLGLWIILLAATWLTAPRWEEVAEDREFAFLPADAPSRRAEEVFKKAFPDDQTGSSVVLVLEHANNEKGGLAQDKKFIEDVLEPRLRQIADDEGGLASEARPPEESAFPDEAGGPQPKQQKSIIWQIRTPNAPVTGSLLVSADGKLLLVVVELTTEFLSSQNWDTIEKVEKMVSAIEQEGKVPPGVKIYLTGSAVTGRDHTQAQLQSAHATEVLTVLLVVILLILIYRAPLVALIPLATVFLAVQVSRQVLALLARAGYVSLFGGIEIYITVLSYGAGVDYCLFLTARYKEELDGGLSFREATANAIGKVGAALTASAGTVMCGIGMMAFAEFGKFREAGIAIPLSLFLVLCATLTFSAALLRLTGRWAFWPQLWLIDASQKRIDIDASQKRIDIDASQKRTKRRPSAGLLLDMLLRSVVKADGFHRAWERMGEVLLRRPGTVWLAAVALMAPFAAAAVLLHNELSYDLIGTLPADAPSVVGSRVLQAHFPAGVMGPTTVLLINPDADFRSDRGRTLVEQLTDRLQEQKGELGLADLRSLSAPLGITPAAKRALAGQELSEKDLQAIERREALEHYVTDLGERAKIGTRLDLILEQSPFARRSVEGLDRVEDIVRRALPDELRQGAQLYFIGPTASMRDVMIVTARDRIRIEILVLLSVFVVLLFLLRKLVVSLYLILSVLFSYFATLGVAFAVFWLLDPQGFAGLDWKVAIFLFTILIAVGEDYNIFLMTRIGEEQERHGPVRGIPEALARTGPIISSCGIIMAGTFASLMAGSLVEMKQLGFALAFGVLLDTFVVRPILVPTFLILLHSGRLGLARQRKREAATQAAVDRPGRTTASS